MALVPICSLEVGTLAFSSGCAPWLSVQTSRGRGVQSSTRKCRYPAHDGTSISFHLTLFCLTIQYKSQLDILVRRVPSFGRPSFASGTEGMLVYTQNDTEITQGRKVVVCDDHPQMRGGVRNVLVGMLGCVVVGEAARGEDAITLLELHGPDMLVLDLSLPGALNGRDVLAEIRRGRFPAKVFVHTAFLNRDDFEEWIDDPEGPDGIDEKGTGDKELAIGFTEVLITDQKYVPLRLIKKFGSHAKGKALDRLP